MEDEPSIQPYLDVDLDFRMGEVDLGVGMGRQDCRAEVLGEVLAREKMLTDSAGPNRERPTRPNAGPRSLLEDAFAQDFALRGRLDRGAQGDHPEDPGEDPPRPVALIHVDVDARLVGLRDALNPFRREEILNVRDEPIPQLPANVPTLQGDFPKPDEDEHEPSGQRCVALYLSASPSPFPVDPATLTLQIVLMFGVAFIYSNLGLGGGLLFVPILLSTGVMDPRVAAPISLTLTIMTASSSVINHHRKGFVDFRLGTSLVAGALVGALIGTSVHVFLLGAAAFKLLFVVVLLAFGAVMVRDWWKNERSVDEDDDTKKTPGRIVGTTGAMVGSGFISGSLGVGGGLLNVPLLVYLLGRKTRVAIGTSSLLIIPTAALGFATYVVELSSQAGQVSLPPDFVLIPILMPVVFVGAFIGSRWGLARLKARSVALLFILVLFVAAVKLVYDLVA